MLYKEELKKVPLCELPKASKAELKGKEYIASTEIVDLQRCGKTLIIDYYSTKNKSLQVRFFSDGFSHILYDAVNDRWCKNYVNTTLYDAKLKHPNFDVYCQEKGIKKAASFLNVKETSFWVDLFGGSYNYRSLYGILAITDRFISKRKEEVKERAREKAEGDFVERQLWFPMCDQNIDIFCNKKAFSEAYIFFSTLDKKRKRTCTCSKCGATWKTTEHPRHKTPAECPECSAKAFWIRESLQTTIKNSTTICQAYKHENQLIMRWQNAQRTFYGNKPHIKYYDEAYTFYLVVKGKPRISSYFYSTAYMGGAHWTKERVGETCYHPAFVYTGNLKEVFGATYYNVDLSSLLENQSKPLNFVKLLDNLKEIPSVEYLCKFGLLNLAAQLDDSSFGPGKNIEQVLGIPKSYIELYKKYDVNAAEHRLLRDLPHYVSEDLWLRFKELNLESFSYNDVLDCCKYQRLDTLCEYVNKKSISENAPRSQIVGWLKDYYNLCENMDIPITKNNVRPRELKKAHDLLTERYNKIKADIKDKKSKAALELVNKWFKGYEKDGYCIKVPHYRSDFIREGQALNHCVGSDSYYNAHKKGTSMIFFIRKKDKPDTSYVTAEIDMISFKVKQCYGMGDKPPKREVIKFVNDFCKWIKNQGVAIERKAG